MRFRLFGTEVEVQLSYVLTALFLSMQRLGEPRKFFLFQLIVFVSILVHELGHVTAVRRHGIQPHIVMHGMGGLTVWRQTLPLRRRDHILISLAGPLAGFLFAALGSLAFAGVKAAGVPIAPIAGWGFDQFLWINVGWGLINLIPVLPWDGGHVLMHALGPRRAKLSAGISLGVGVAAAIVFMNWHMPWAALLFGLGAFTSYQAYQAASEGARAPRPRDPEPDNEEVTGEVRALLTTARAALEAEQHPRAEQAAVAVLSHPGSPARARRQAFEIVAAVKFAEGHAMEAAAALREASRLGPIDPLLAALLLRSQGEVRAARRVLEEARANGDSRKDVAAQLIQLLLDAGEVSRAAAVAYDIVDQLSADDIRRMTELALSGRAFDWGARLSEALFQRDGDAEAAYVAARAHALGGATERALQWLRRATAAGLSQPSRAWFDEAFEGLRDGGLATVVPRP
jgi:Zn-dependent protease